MQKSKHMTLALLCGMLGCLCFGGGDWLMIYGDTTHSGSLYWLTEGVKQIAPWRNLLAMALSFPGIILYGVALFSIESWITEPKNRRVYHYLTVFGLTPWLALHLFYVMILYLFAWLNGNGYAQAAIPAAEALYSHLSWVVIVSEGLMLPPFVYWAWLSATGKTVHPRRMAAINPLTLYVVLSVGKVILPDGAFRIGFINGLMSESMILWFVAFIIWYLRRNQHVPQG
ncbi:MAG: hypothetical protein E7323_09385 [Clostridiales bacterium]|nr:hypothetical protein [Clostridiales bacterium]